jgi:hypothetical protein
MTATTAEGTAKADVKSRARVLAKGAKAVAKATGISLVAPALTYLAHLVFAVVLSWALRHGFDVSVSWFPLSLVTYFGLGIGGMVVERLTQALYRGKQAAEDERSAKLAKAVMANPALLASLIGGGAKGAAKTSDIGNIGNFL